MSEAPVAIDVILLHQQVHLHGSLTETSLVKRETSPQRFLLTTSADRDDGPKPYTNPI